MDTQATSLVKLKDTVSALKDADQPLVVIAGATATGKSAFALDLADHMPSTIINADSMQVYDAIPILTAQPTAQERAQAPHALYGFLPPDDACSAARWSALALQAIQSAWDDRRLPILVGGTGLYLRSLLRGIADVPDIDPAIRTSVRAQLEAEGPAPLYEQLSALDPDGAARLSPNDRQRIARALEVVLATGTLLAEWQTHAAPGLLDQPGVTALRVVAEMDRETLYARCERRLDAMLSAGALDELAELMRKDLASDTPILRAVGVPPLAQYMREALSFEEAVELAKRDTRRFAKRQLTWFRHQFADWTRLSQ